MKKVIGGLGNVGRKAWAWLRRGQMHPSQGAGLASKPPRKAGGLWTRSWREFVKGLAYLFPWLLIPLAVLVVIISLYVVEACFGPSRNIGIVLISRVNAILSQPVLLAALLTAVVGFGIKLWERAKEEERLERERIQGEVEAVGRLLRERRWEEALRSYRDFSRRRDRAWGEQEIQDQLREVWNREAPDPLRGYADCLERCPQPDIPPFGQWANGDVGKAVEALFWAHENLGEEEYDRATRKWG